MTISAPVISRVMLCSTERRHSGARRRREPEIQMQAQDTHLDSGSGAHAPSRNDWQMFASVSSPVLEIKKGPEGPCQRTAFREWSSTPGGAPFYNKRNKIARH